MSDLSRRGPHAAHRLVRWTAVVGAALSALAGAAPAVAQTVPGDAWRGAYYDNIDLAGDPVLTRIDAAIDFDWGGGAPSAAVPDDRFGVRWERWVDHPGGRYRVEVTVDDGVRVTLDGAIVIDAWHDQATTRYVREIDLAPGRHLMRVEYYERAGNARLTVSAGPVAAPAGGWRGEYFGNAGLSGAPLLVREDSAIDFDWGSGSPAQGTLPADHFSVRWTKVVGFTPGRYRFATTSDDGVRLWVNGRLVLDRWLDMSATTVSDVVDVPGPAEVRLEYFEGIGAAKVRLTWSPAGGAADGGVPGAPVRHTVQPGDTLFSLARRYGTTVAAIQAANGLKGEQINAGQTLWIPRGGGPGPSPAEIVVDEQSGQILRGGDPTAWQRAAAGFGGSTWTLNNTTASPDYNWMRWIPALAPGRYEVFAFIPSRNANTHAARYWVAHADGFGGRVVDQAAYSDAWVSLGTYRFTGDGKEYAALNDITGEPRLSRRIGFDAVKWVPR